MPCGREDRHGFGKAGLSELFIDDNHQAPYRDLVLAPMQCFEQTHKGKLNGTAQRESHYQYLALLEA